MKRNERTTYNQLKKTVDEKTLYVEIPLTWTHEARQAAHELLTIEKGMYASCIGPEVVTGADCIRYTHSSEYTADTRRAQENADIDDVAQSIRRTEYAWNGYKPTQEAQEPAEQQDTTDTTADTENAQNAQNGPEKAEEKKEEKTMSNTTKELREYCDNIRKELNAIYEGTTEETNDDGEQMTLYDYFSDVLDWEYSIGCRGDFLGVRVYVALGGPNVWIDTRRGEIGGAWGTDRAESWLPSEIAEEIDDIFREYYESTK